MTREQEITNYVAMALADDPEGATCHWCGKENTWADDIGWFYCCPVSAGTGSTRDDESGPTCEACDKGEIGQQHRARWGEGDR